MYQPQRSHTHWGRCPRGATTGARSGHSRTIVLSRPELLQENALPCSIPFMWARSNIARIQGRAGPAGGRSLVSYPTGPEISTAITERISEVVQRECARPSAELHQLYCVSDKDGESSAPLHAASCALEDHLVLPRARVSSLHTK